MAKLRIAFLGTGGIAGKHAKTLEQHPDCELVAGCDVDEQRVQQFFQRTIPEYGNEAGEAPAAFHDAATMYREAKPDAVVICTPHTLHFAHGMQALDHGCHVLMEKPMVTSTEDAYKLADKVKESGKLFVIGYNTPCSPEFNYIRDTIRSKRLGELELINGFLSQNWRKFTKGLWRQDPKLSGGGQAYDSGAHLLNSLCWSVEQDVDEVFAYVDNMDTPVDINSVIAIKFKSGVMANMTVSGNCPANGSHMVFIFSEGRIDVDGWGASWMEVFDGGKKVKYPKVEGEPTGPAENFIDAILGRAEPRTTPFNGIVQSQLMDCVYESQRTGQPAKAMTR